MRIPCELGCLSHGRNPHGAHGVSNCNQSELSKRIASGEYINSKTFYWLDINNKIYYTTQGYSRVPRAYRNYVYLTNEEAIDGYYKKINFSYFEADINKAWINTENNWLYHWGEKSEELAVLGAFYNCEFMGLSLNDCKLLYINDKRISNYDDMYWTRFYLENRDSYTFKAGPSKKLIIEKKGKSSRSEASVEKIVSSGTGFFVNKRGEILTNFHVIENCEDNMKGRINRDVYPLKFIARDKSLDLALLKAPVNNDSYIPLESSAPRKLQRVIVAGYPLGNIVSDTIKVTKGIVSATKGMDNDVSQFEIDAVIRKGNSGGPVYDKRGNIVGVAVSRLNVNRAEYVNFGIKGSTVKQFLSAHDIPTKWSNRNQDISSKDIYKIASKQTVMVVCHHE